MRKELSERRERIEKSWDTKYTRKYSILLLDYHYDNSANTFYFRYNKNDKITTIEWSNYSNLDISYMKEITDIGDIHFKEFPDGKSISMVKDKLLDYLESLMEKQ